MVNVKDKLIKGQYVGKKIKKGTVFNYEIFVSESYRESGENAFVLTFDGLNTAQAEALEMLVRDGEMTSFVALGVYPGVLPSTNENEQNRNMRKDEYDSANRDFSDFLVDEFIPEILSLHSIKISSSPDLHMISGGSSGGIAAFCGAWWRNDFFRRAFISSPSFLAMADGEDIPFLIRKLEARPIKICLTLGENEPDDYFGASYPVGLLFERSLRFSGYDYEYRYFPNEGHCCRIHDVPSQTEFMRWLWKDSESGSVTIKAKNLRILDLIGENTTWEPCDMPKFKSSLEAFSEFGRYYARGGEIYLESISGETKKVGDGFGNITAIAFSADSWRLYLTDDCRGYVFAYSIMPDGSLDCLYKLGTLHKAKDQIHIGGLDIAVDSNDRLYIASDIGVQCMRSFGIVDIILPLPGDICADKVTLAGNILYAAGNGKCFSRKLCACEKTNDTDVLLRHTGYYD